MEREIHDQNLTESENFQLVMAGSFVEMFALGIYGITSLVMVSNKCSHGTVGGSPCHVITWTLTVSSFVWGISVGYLFYTNTSALSHDRPAQNAYVHTGGGFQNRLY